LYRLIFPLFLGLQIVFQKEHLIEAPLLLPPTKTKRRLVWCQFDGPLITQGTGAEMPKVNGAKSDPTAAPAFRRVSPVVGWLLGSCLSLPQREESMF